MVPRTSPSLAPGYRFHPTDEELVRYYLRRKILGKRFYDGAIAEIDIYRAEPWDLPGKSAVKSRDLEWYFFSGLDKKYGNGDRTNRATEQGYWKTTGKDRPVYHKCQVVGMKKTLVYHHGRAPKGLRTNWVMHEYRLMDEDIEKAGFMQDAFVLCRVFQKSGSGPKNGEQYGAPFVEEEWEGDELEMFPKLEAADEVEVGDDACLDGIELEQILATGIPTNDGPIPLDNYYGENVISCEETTNSSNDSQKVSAGVAEYNCITVQSEDHKLYNFPVHQDVYQELVDDSQVSGGACDYHGVTEQSQYQTPHNLPFEYGIHQKPVKNEFIAGPSKLMNTVDADFILDQPYMDAMDNFHFGNGAFLEANDLDNPIVDTSGGGLLDDYVTFFDADDYLTFDNLELLGDNGTPVSGEETLYQKDFKNETQLAALANQLLSGNDVDDASSSKLPTKDYASDFQDSFLKQASCMLESIRAPPAYASEFPSKDAALSLYPSSSSTAHVTAGMIQIENMGLGSHVRDWLSEKHGRYNIVLSFGLSRGIDNSTTLESVVRINPGKAASGIFRGWYCFMFFWVLILSVSFKIGAYICAR